MLNFMPLDNSRADLWPERSLFAPLKLRNSGHPERHLPLPLTPQGSQEPLPAHLGPPQASQSALSSAALPASNWDAETHHIIICALRNTQAMMHTVPELGLGKSFEGATILFRETVSMKPPSNFGRNFREICSNFIPGKAGGVMGGVSEGPRRERNSTTVTRHRTTQNGTTNRKRAGTKRALM
jgi:hypothetical protein